MIPSAVEFALQHQGIKSPVRHLDSSTRTVADAARSLGCGEAQIGKSIVFCTDPGGKAVLVIASGTNRISEERIASLIGEQIKKADADFVRKHTGFSIGGVPPVGHRQPIRTLIDRDLLQFNTVYAAAGTPYSVMELSKDELCALLPDAIQTSIT